MSGQKLQKQHIEDVIGAVLAGKNMERATAFVSFVRSLRMTPQWASHHSWAVSYKGKRICYIKVSEKATGASWYIRPAVQYDDALEAFCRAEGLIPCMLKNVHFCVACGRCAPGKTVTFFGQRLEHVCCAPIDFEFHEPDEEELACAKKLVLYSRQRIGQQNEGASKQA
ncbi:MAG: hypothetical protein IJ350_00805 [Clostridia bacterium]|nr:hypothetical protein [Clostridia bacterium]MBQ7864878.1 hypothetical protein [Clostridia bacterium]